MSLVDEATVELEHSPLALAVRDARTRHRSGRFMQAIGVAGVVTAILGSIVGWQLVGQVDTTVQGSLELTSETLTTLEDTIVVAADVIESVDQSLAITEETLNDVESSFGQAELVVAEVDVVLESVAGNVDTASTTVDDLAVVGRTIDNVLAQLSSVPFGPEYDPSIPLGDQLQLLADELAPISESLDSTSAELDEFVVRTQDLESDIAALADAVGEINTDLDASEALLDSYLQTARGARDLSDETRADLEGDVRNTRLLIILGGLMFALGQIVPFWVGTELTATTSPTPRG